MGIPPPPYVDGDFMKFRAPKLLGAVSICETTPSAPSQEQETQETQVQKPVFRLLRSV